MGKGFLHLLKKDFRLMLSGKFFLLALISLALYSCYINMIYVRLEQKNFQIYLCDPLGRFAWQEGEAERDNRCVSLDWGEYITSVSNRQELEAACADRASIGIDLSGDRPELYLLSSGVETLDRYRAAWAGLALSSGMSGPVAPEAPALPSGIGGPGSSDEPELSSEPDGPTSPETTERIGEFDREQRSRREITAEFLFFELSAVGFLGLASLLFKEKQMGVIRVHGVLPVKKTAFILSKAGLFLLSDLMFAVALVLINIGPAEGIAVLPAVLVQAGILSLLMALVGFCCAIWLHDFKQFSLFYLVLAVFLTSPVYLAGQTGIAWGWITYHPAYHLFAAMKSACFGAMEASPRYYLISAGAVIVLFCIACRALSAEMAKEG